MSRPILAASAGCDDDAHTAGAAPAGGAMTRIKGTVIRTAATAAVHPRLSFTCRILSGRPGRMQTAPVPSMVNRFGPAVQYRRHLTGPSPDARG